MGTPPTPARQWLLPYLLARTMTGMHDAFCSSTRPRRSMHRATADRVGHRAPEVSYRASSRPVVGLSKRQSTCSRDLYHPHPRLAGLPGYVAGVRCVSLDVHQTYEKSSYRKLRELEDMKRAGVYQPRLSSLWARERLRGCPAALIPTVGSHGRRSVGLLPHGRLPFPCPEHGYATAVASISIRMSG